MMLSFFNKKFAAVFIAIMLVVPGFYSAVQTQQALAMDCPIGGCEAEVTSWVHMLNQYLNTIADTWTQINTAWLVEKEKVLDPIARLMGVEMTNELTNRMFNLIAEGNVNEYVPGEAATGKEAFVTNPQNYFGDVGEKSTAAFLTDLRTNRPERMESVNEAVRQRIIADNYVDPGKMNQSTFPGGDAAYQDFVKNGTCPTGNYYDCYFSSLEPQNDPWSIYQFESSRLTGQRTADVTLEQNQIREGSGYITLKDCIEKDIDENCTDYLNKTPGDTLAREIAKYLENTLTNFQNVHEFEEMGGVIDQVGKFLDKEGLAHLGG